MEAEKEEVIRVCIDVCKRSQVVVHYNYEYYNLAFFGLVGYASFILLPKYCIAYVLFAVIGATILFQWTLYRSVLKVIDSMCTEDKEKLYNFIFERTSKAYALEHYPQIKLSQLRLYRDNFFLCALRKYFREKQNMCMLFNNTSCCQ